jgi:hypothetical protein
MISDAHLLLSLTAGIQRSHSVSRHRQILPFELLEHVISYISPEQIDANFARVSVMWYVATLSAVRNRLREAIAQTEGMMCTRNGQTVCLDLEYVGYPEGAEVRWTPVKWIEGWRKRIIVWYNVLCRVVGRLEHREYSRMVDRFGNIL